MSTQSNLPFISARRYQITVEGVIGESWSDWLSGMDVVTHKEADGTPITTLRGMLIDQVALRGLLNRLWDLNLVLRSVQQLDLNAMDNIK